ncbi:MAG: T9SS type A sorting domain-containing protein [Bacteroidales bacterium]|nr:T9SS type A sorting domain-containing protein [Bacteroidales bacterium]
MKIKIFTTCITMMGMLSLSSFAQELEVPWQGDPLNEVILADTTAEGVQAHDTYVLERGGYYVLTGSITFKGDSTTIEAEEGEGMRPIILMGTDNEGATYGWGVIWCEGVVTLRDLRFPLTNDLGNRGWNSLLSVAGENITAIMDNCIVDFNDGMLIGNDRSPDQTIILTNNLFRWGGESSWGGPWSGFGPIIKNANVEGMYIENNTWVDCIAPMVVYESGNLKNFWFNHNTVVNHAQFFTRSEYWNNAIFMNNLFVNPHFVGETLKLRFGQDPDLLPYGVVTVATPHDSIVWPGFPAKEERVLLFAHNNNYVADEIKQWWQDAPGLLPDTADFQVADYAKGDNGFLNSRAVSLMADDANYPYFLWDDNYSMHTVNPSFNGYTFDYDEIRKFAEKMAGVQDAPGVSVGIEGWARHPEDTTNRAPVATDFYTFDYASNELKGAAYQGYPVGDLNWWPDLKATWEADTAKETYEKILASVKDGTWEFKSYNTVGIEDRTDNSSGITLNQCYPNPASGYTNITFSIPGESSVSLRVYNIFGQEVLNVLDKQYPAGEFETRVDLRNLSSGTYFYQLRVDGFSQTRKMTLL